MKIYAVGKGHKPGIYFTWADCQKQITGFSQAQFKKFSTVYEAEEYLQVTNVTDVQTVLLDPTVIDGLVCNYQSTNRFYILFI